MKRKRKRSLLCILLVLVMVFSLAPTGLAKSSIDSNVTPDYTNYFAIGTSITGSYGLPSTKHSQTGWGQDLYSAFKEDSFGTAIADDLNIPDGGRVNGARVGTRSTEFRYTLDDSFSEVDAYDDFWVGQICGNGYRTMKGFASDYRQKIKNADIITIELGLNDVSSYSMYCTMSELATLQKGRQLSGQELASLMMDPNAFVNAFADDLQKLEDVKKYDENGNVDKFAGISTFMKMLDDSETCYGKMMDYNDEGMENFKRDFPVVIQKIRELNPTADIFLLGTYNSMEYMVTHNITDNENGSVSLKNLFLETGKRIGITEEETAYWVKVFNDLTVTKMNDAIKEQCDGNNQCHYVDLTSIDLSGSTDGTHPNLNGHAFIAQQTLNEVYKLYTSCEHRHVVNRGAYAPTESASGYTGNLYCADCDKCLESGETISYAEYQAQQDIDPGSGEGVQEDPLVYPQGTASAQLSDLHRVTAPQDGKTFAITYANRALAASANSGYQYMTSELIDNYNTRDTYYYHSGLNGRTVQYNGDGTIKKESLAEDLLWVFEQSGDGFKIKNAYTGQYLNDAYKKEGGGSTWGAVQPTHHTYQLFMSDTGDTVWTYNGTNLISSKTQKALSFAAKETLTEAAKSYEGCLYLFSVGDSGHDMNLFYVASPAATPTPNQLLGKCVVWEQAPLSQSTFAVVVNDHVVGLDADNKLVATKISDTSQISFLSDKYQWNVHEVEGQYVFENAGAPLHYLGAYTDRSTYSTMAAPIVSTGPFRWDFNNNHLTKVIQTLGALNLGVDETYTLACDNGILSMTTGNVNDGLKLYKKNYAYTEHQIRESAEGGRVTYTCALCGASFTKGISAEDHGDGNNDHRCDDCGLVLDSQGQPVPDNQQVVDGKALHKMTVDGKVHYYRVGEEVHVSAGSRDNKSFTQWTLSGVDIPDIELFDEDIMKSDIAFYMADHDVSFESNWATASNITLSFEGNGGTAFETLECKTGETIDLRAYIPVRPGYTFNGWYTDKNLSSKAGDTITLTGNTVLYAGWVEKTVTPKDTSKEKPFSREEAPVSGQTFVDLIEALDAKDIDTATTIMTDKTMIGVWKELKNRDLLDLNKVFQSLFS